MSVLTTELKVIGCLALVLVAFEGTMRVFEERLSKDIGHLKQFAELSEDLAHPEDQRAVQLLFLGNSMTRYGVDGLAFERTLEQTAHTSVEWTKVNPDNTALADWVFVYRNFFEDPAHRPDVIVLGFEGHHLQDAPSHHPNRLARFYCGPDDWPELTHYDLKTFEQRMEFLVCDYSALWANRDRVERRVLDTVIPGYREASQEVNVTQVQSRESTAPKPTFHRLEEFLERIEDEHVHIVFAAMPLANEYEIPAELLTLLHRHHAECIDCRHIPGITRSMFPDGIHMTPTAATIYSKYLAHEMARYPQFVGLRPVKAAALQP